MTLTHEAAPAPWDRETQIELTPKGRAAEAFLTASDSRASAHNEPPRFQSRRRTELLLLPLDIPLDGEPPPGHVNILEGKGTEFGVSDARIEEGEKDRFVSEGVERGLCCCEQGFDLGEGKGLYLIFSMHGSHKPRHWGDGEPLFADDPIEKSAKVCVIALHGRRLHGFGFVGTPPATARLGVSGGEGVKKKPQFGLSTFGEVSMLEKPKQFRGIDAPTGKSTLGVLSNLTV